MTAFLRYLPIGNCGACRELKFFLRGSYSQDLFEFFMRSHKVNCITREKREQFFFNKFVTKDDFMSVYICDLSSVIFKRLKSDHRLEHKYEALVADKVKLRNTNVIASTFSIISSEVMMDAPLVLVVNQYRCKCHGFFTCCKNEHEKNFDCCYREEFWFVSELSPMFREKPVSLFERKMRIEEQMPQNVNAKIKSKSEMVDLTRSSPVVSKMKIKKKSRVL